MPDTILLHFSLPLTNPVIIFSVMLFIILFAPLLLNKIKIPHIIGLIIAGVIIGPYGLNLLQRDSSIVLFGTVGILYIMFLAGLEIDLAEFKRNTKKIIFFGLMTFILPLTFGVLASHYILGYSFLSSILLASMFSTHTLVSYPIVSRFGITRNRAVTLTIGATMITDILALLILAGVAGSAKEEISSSFWWQLGIASTIFVLIVFLIFPIITRWFFKRIDDGIAQYIFVLAMVFLAAFLAEIAGLEPIIGAFFAGLVLNKFVPNSSPLMNRINFVGNAIFIPFFLIGVGMLVDVSIIIQGWGALKVAGVIIVVAVITKYLAAFLTQKIFKMSSAEGKLLFGLSTSHAAATLAIILVGYNIIIGETIDGAPIRLLNDDVLNGTILLILVSCAISTFTVERASEQIAEHAEMDSSNNEETETDNVLIAVSEPETIRSLTELGLMFNDKKSKTGMFALSVVDDRDDGEEKRKTVDKMMKAIEEQAAGYDKVSITPIIRYDQHVSKGILYTIKEHQITDVILGVTQAGEKKNKIGHTTGQILSSASGTVFIHHSLQPFNTLRRIRVAVNPLAEAEDGFPHWVKKVFHIALKSGLPLVFHTNATTMEEIERINRQLTKPLTLQFKEMNDWDEFLLLSRDLEPNDLLIAVSSRPGFPSYFNKMDQLPLYLKRYFDRNSYIVIYPEQVASYSKLEDLYQEEGTFLDVFSEGKKVADKAGSFISNLWRKKPSS